MNHKRLCELYKEIFGFGDIQVWNDFILPSIEVYIMTNPLILETQRENEGSIKRT